MEYYVGLDVSQRQTAICVVDKNGKVVVEGKSMTQPADIYGWLVGKNIDPCLVERAGLEAGAMSSWLYTELVKLGLPMICLEAFQAHRFLQSNRNKNDRNDARGLAQLVRMGGEYIRSVTIRSQANQEARMLLTMRQKLVDQKVGLENNITGCLKPFGLVVPRGDVVARTFCGRVMEAITRSEEMNLKLRSTITPMLDLYEKLCEQLALLTKQVEGTAKANAVCRQLMTVPGVGPIVSLSFVTAVDNPERFSRGEDVGAYFGLTPRQFQSGETDHQIGISRAGNCMTRNHLVQAATTLLFSSKKWCPLKSWGLKIAQKRGFHKARIAVARKLAVILHRMWINGQDFRWTNKAENQELVGVTPT